MAKPKPQPGRKTRTYSDGAWHDGSPPVLAPDSQAMWLSSIVFYGAAPWAAISRTSTCIASALITRRSCWPSN